jgi:hypothetical protein
MPICKTRKTRKYLVVGSERLRFSMEVEATSKAEARRKFEEYTKDGACGWDSVGTSVRVAELPAAGGAE